MSNLAGPGWPLQTWWPGNLIGFHTKRLSVPVEELIAVAGSRGFEAPSGIQSDQILLDGVILPYSNAGQSPSIPTLAFHAAISGSLLSAVISIRYILGFRKDNPNVFNSLIKTSRISNSIKCICY